jgi:DNA-binding beta-propeller fold protein YncE
MDRRAFVAGAAAAVAAPRAFAGRLGYEDISLVTADLESRLVVVAVASGAIQGHVHTEAKPRSIETVGTRAVIAHSDLGLVTLVDAATLRVTRVLHDFGEPRYTAAHPDARHAYVTDAKRGEVVALDVVDGRVLGRVQVGALARHVSIDPAGRRLWVALGRKAKRIAIVDVAARSRPRLLGVVAPPFLAHDVGWTPDGARVWVTSGDRDELAIYDAASARVVRRLGGDAPPQHVTFHASRAYVASGDSGTVRTHLVGGRELRSARVPTGSYNVQQAHGWVVTPGLGRGSFCILDLAGRVERRLQIARSSHDACIVRV